MPAPSLKPPIARFSGSTAIQARLRAGPRLKAEFAGRLTLAETPFSHMEEAAKAAGWDAVDGVALDLGVSSMQLDEAERGFSFMRDGPLDMRMSGKGLYAADVVNTFEKDAIANILYELGEERRSRAIAAAIVPTARRRRSNERATRRN